MRRNYEEERASALEDEKLNPMQAMIGLVVLVAVVVIFCFAVWKITHANRPGALPGQGVENSQDSIANWGGQTIGSSETTPGDSLDPVQSSEEEQTDNPLGMEF